MKRLIGSDSTAPLGWHARRSDEESEDGEEQEDEDDEEEEEDPREKKKRLREEGGCQCLSLQAVNHGTLRVPIDPRFWGSLRPDVGCGAVLKSGHLNVC
jgi:hypothetical protein